MWTPRAGQNTVLSEVKVPVSTTNRRIITQSEGSGIKNFHTYKNYHQSTHALNQGLNVHESRKYQLYFKLDISYRSCKCMW